MLVLGALTDARGPSLGLAAAGAAFVVAGLVAAVWPGFSAMDRSRALSQAADDTTAPGSELGPTH
jgi:hypothetical protein